MAISQLVLMNLVVKPLHTQVNAKVDWWIFLLNDGKQTEICRQTLALSALKRNNPLTLSDGHSKILAFTQLSYNKTGGGNVALFLINILSEADMEMHQHSMPDLFMQLGLESSDDNIREFVKTHSGLVVGTVLHEAFFWSPSQAAFLKQAIDEDADWAELVDQLDAMLRG